MCLDKYFFKDVKWKIKKKRDLSLLQVKHNDKFYIIKFLWKPQEEQIIKTSIEFEKKNIYTTKTSKKKQNKKLRKTSY